MTREKRDFDFSLMGRSAQLVGRLGALVELICLCSDPAQRYIEQSVDAADWVTCLVVHTRNSTPVVPISAHLALNQLFRVVCTAHCLVIPLF